MVLKKFRNKKGGRTFSESWSKGTSDIKSGAVVANEKRKEMIKGIRQGVTDFTSGFKNKHRENQIKAMTPSLTVGGRRRRRRHSKKRKTRKSRKLKRKNKRAKKTRRRRRRR